MSVEPASAAGRHVHQGVAYYFCSNHCLAKFQSDPARYLEPGAAARPEAMPDGEYTCPMHPEVVRQAFGSCPDCGMALEPREISLEEPANPELDAMRRRFAVSAVLAFPVAVMGMMHRFDWIQLALSIPIVLWCGWPIFERGWRGAASGSPNMFTLLALGIGASFAYSVTSVLAPSLLPHDFHGMVYFEAAAVIVTLVLLGQVLELRARAQTSSAIRALLQLAPKTARLVEASGDRDIPVEQIRPGDLLRVRPGERVPADGTVTEGASSIDESMFTGEPEPAEKSPGARVTGGALNGTGSFVMRAERVGRDALLGRIVSLVNQAQRSRAPIQRLADRVAGFFVPLVIAVAVLTFAAWSLWGPEPRFVYALVNATAVLVIACPCALGLATPMSVMAGMGRGARAGVLIANAGTLETLARVDTLVFDKTGTLTEGRPRLTSFEPPDPALIRIAASLEQSSEHPLASAVLEFARRKGVDPAPVSRFAYFPGKGVAAMVEGRAAALGNERLLEALGLPPHPGTSLAVDGAIAATLTFEDPLKPDAAAIVGALRAAGLDVIVASGDRPSAVEAAARAAGIARVHPGMLPEAKHDLVAGLISAGRIVAMAGDGVNDAPALARAHVGIAMGNGSDIAVQTAGVTLVKGELRGILRARRLSQAVMRNIRQNLFFAFCYNLLGVPVAAGVLYPVFGILLSPMIAAAAMTFSSVSVIANALRLRDIDL